jgi:hypothetical protein
LAISRITFASIAALLLTSCGHTTKSIPQRPEGDSLIEAAIAASHHAGNPQQEIDFIASQMERGGIVSVEILSIPPDIERPFAVSSQELRKNYVYKVSIPMRVSSRQRPSLVDALKKTKVTGTNSKADLRWGALFTFEGGQVEGIYLDGFGKLGQIDEVPVQFDGGIYDWLRGFSVCLK